MKTIKRIINDNDNQLKFAVGDYKYWPEDLNAFTFYDFMKILFN